MTRLEFEPLSHSYWFEGERVPSVTHIIRPLEGYYRMSETLLRPYAERGSAVHELTERWDKTPLEDDFDPEQVPSELRGYLLAWINFRNDFDFAPTHIEHQVFHPRLFYAGTIDRVGVVRNQLSIVDIKTSAKLGPAVGVQLAAYQHALESEEEVTGRYAVQLADDGTYRVVEYTNPLDWDAFRGCLALHTWQEQHRIQLVDVRPRIIQVDGESAWPQFVREGRKG